MTAHDDRAHEARSPTSADYQREAEHTRRRLALDLDELSDRLTPGQVFDEMLTYSRAGGGTFFRAFSNAMRENPLPSLMIGAGCMMFLSEKMGLMSARANGGRLRAPPDDPYGFPTSSAPGMGSRLSESAGRVSDAAGRVSDAAARMAGSATSSAQAAAASVGASVSNAADAARRQTSDLLGGALETAKQATAAAGDTAGGAMDAVRSVAHDARDTGAAAVAGAASSVRDTATSFISEQPLLCAAIGIAIGATLATMLPSTDTENKLMGETSDAVKDAAQRTGSQAMESAKNVASKVAERAQTAVKEEGLSVSGVAQAAGLAGEDPERDAPGVVRQPLTGTGPQEGTAGSSSS